MKPSRLIDNLKCLAAESQLVQRVRDIPLTLFPRQTYSQHGEDRFLLDEVFAGRDAPGTYVDIGASHPIRISNTYLLYLHGWSGLTVEPIERLQKLHRVLRPRDRQLECLIGAKDGTARFYQVHPSVLSTASAEHYEQLVAQGIKTKRIVDLPQLSLTSLIQQYLGHSKADFLNVDIEGLDQVVAAQLAVIDKRLLPRCICIECNDSVSMAETARLVGPRFVQMRQFGPNLIFWNQVTR